MLNPDVDCPNENLSYEVPEEYVSDEDDLKEPEQPKKIFNDRKNCLWIQVASFLNNNGVKKWVKDSGTWSYWYSNKTSIGFQAYCRCNIKKRRGNQCPSRIYFLYPKDSQHVLLF